MIYIFTIICSLFLASSFAETIGKVEYKLPQIAENWEIGTKFTTENGNTIVYIPKGGQTETSRQFFAVNNNFFPINLDNIQVVKTLISNFFPNMQLEVKELAKSKEGATYEWTVSRENVETIHGWGRVFLGEKNEVVVLIYQTRDIADLENSKAIWLPVIQDAKVVTPTTTAPLPSATIQEPVKS